MFLLLFISLNNPLRAVFPASLLPITLVAPSFSSIVSSYCAQLFMASMLLPISQTCSLIQLTLITWWFSSATSLQISFFEIAFY
jgi:hypothetical protein